MARLTTILFAMLLILGACSSGESQAAGSGADTGTATVTLENGDVYQFSVVCSLGPVDAGVADRALLFSVDSFEDSTYHLTASVVSPDKYGNGELSLIQIWSMSNNEMIWEADSTGGEIELDIDDETVTGSAIFWAGGDTANPSVRGDLVANC